MSRLRLGERLGWRVTIPEHTIVDDVAHHRFHMPETVTDRHEKEAETAISMAVLELHVRENVPPWRPYTRQTRVLATAERVMVNTIEQEGRNG